MQHPWGPAAPSASATRTMLPLGLLSTRTPDGFCGWQAREGMAVQRLLRRPHGHTACMPHAVRHPRPPSPRMHACMRTHRLLDVVCVADEDQQAVQALCRQLLPGRRHLLAPRLVQRLVIRLEVQGLWGRCVFSVGGGVSRQDTYGVGM